jgi:hypothetical protein
MVPQTSFGQALQLIRLLIRMLREHRDWEIFFAHAK